MRRQRRQNVLRGAVLVEVPGDPEGRQGPDFVGAGDRPAEDQDGQAPGVELANRPHQFHARGVRQAQIEHQQVDGDEVRLDPCQQFRRALDDDRPVSRALERGPETIAHERSIVGDDDRLRRNGSTGHVRYNPILIASVSAGRILARHPSNCQTERDARAEERMATCPECDAEIEVDEFDVDKGDQLSCPECGSNLEVIGLSPIELDLADEDDDDDDDERRGRQRRRGRRR